MITNTTPPFVFHFAHMAYVPAAAFTAPTAIAQVVIIAKAAHHPTTTPANKKALVKLIKKMYAKA